MKGKTIAVWFSNGAASAVAAKMTIETYGKDNTVLVVNNPVFNEECDNIRFQQEVSNWLKVDIIHAKNKDFPNCLIEEVFEKRKYMSGVKGAPCTQLLKKEARYQFEKETRIDFHVMGYTFDEQERHKRFVKYERGNVLPILIDKGITKEDCFTILRENGIELPRSYRLGLPNANCLGCVKSQSPTYWNLIRRIAPKVFLERAEQSRRLGCKLVKLKGKRIYLDELKETDKGGKLKSWECGIFCELPKYLI